MRKIKLLNIFVVALISLYILFFIGNIYVTFFSNFMEQFRSIYDDFIFGYYTQFVSIIFSIFSFIGLLYIRNGLAITLNSGFFNSDSSHNFKVAGGYFFVSGLLRCIFEFVVLFYSGNLTSFSSIGQSFLLIILSFVLYIISDIIKNGNDLKLDHELTI